MRRVVIVGGGFCGVVTAINLVRLTDTPLSVTVVNAGAPLGRGVAYGTRRREHLLNVVARNMSALADQPDHFLDWLGTRCDFADRTPGELREQFVPRGVYGDYLQSLFLWYRRAFADGKRVRIDHVDAEVLDVFPEDDQVAVLATGGVRLEADKVVLATGNVPPTDLNGVASDHPHYFRNPWGGWEEHLPDRTQDVVLLGTGLTMMDAFLSLTVLDWQGKVYAVSRNGLLPLSHFKGPDYPGFPEGDPVGLRLDEMLAMFETHCAQLRRGGLEPAILVDKMRPFTQRIWQAFTQAERQRFLGQFRTLWNVTRHRAPEVVHRAVGLAIASGRLEIVKGKVMGLSESRSLLRVQVEGERSRTIEAGAVINCTGPADGYGEGGPELYRNLLARGLVSPDDVGLGIRATADFAAIEADGSRSTWLMVLGSPLRGMLWESTAVPELRNQAFRVAEVIVADMHASRARVQPVEQTAADVLEYTI